MHTTIFIKFARISFLAVALALIIPLTATAAGDKVMNEILSDSIVIGKASTCASAAKQSSEFGYKIGQALAGYYVKKYPKYDRYKMSDAITSGLRIGESEQKEQGWSLCPRATKQANSLLKKYGSVLRY